MLAVWSSWTDFCPGQKDGPAQRGKVQRGMDFWSAIGRLTFWELITKRSPIGDQKQLGDGNIDGCDSRIGSGEPGRDCRGRGQSSGVVASTAQVGVAAGGTGSANDCCTFFVDLDAAAAAATAAAAAAAATEHI